MVAVENLVVVFVAGLFTALATGVGALPFVLLDDVSARSNVVLWGIASGIMVSASLFGLVGEGLAEGAAWEVGVGVLAGVVLVVLARQRLLRTDVDPSDYEAASRAKLALILGILTVHSFPEGVAIGVSFADLNLGTGIALFGLTVPPLAAFMTVAIAIHNVPEGTAIAIPLRSMDVPERRMVWWAIFSSLPQPIGAVFAFAFVSVAREALAIGFGFAAGAMIYLVLSEFVPEALDLGTDLRRRGIPELAVGLGVGVLAMVPLLFV